MYRKLQNFPMPKTLKNKLAKTPAPSAPLTRDEIIVYVRELVKSHFKDEAGAPIILTDSQCILFDLIYRKPYARVHVEAFTRFGKSLTIALAILCRITTYPEKWAIAAGNDKQAAIIMGYLIAHIFDDNYFSSKFAIADNESFETIRRYKNKDRINFKVEKDRDGQWLLGEVFITNAKGAMGFGAPNIVGDESALVPDNEEALIARMLGDKITNFYIKVGNPWDSGHFRASFDDEKYHKLIVDYKVGIKEERFTIDQMLEMQKKPFWDVLYECKFPPRDTMGEGGWISLLTKDDIDRNVIRVSDIMDKEIEGFGLNRLGGDVAGGGKNFSVLVQRYTNFARMLIKSKDPDTMAFAEAIINQKKKLNVLGADVFIDKVGIGRGVFDIAARELEGVRGVNAGDALIKDSMDAALYTNLRAAMYWRTREWILRGGKLLAYQNEDLNDTWYQLTKIKYRKKLQGTRGKVQIMSKEDMLKIGVDSPDVADALALTFAVMDMLPYDAAEEAAQNSLADKYGLFPTV